MQAWIVKCKTTDGVFMAVNNCGTHTSAFPQFFEDRDQARVLAECAGADWQVVEVEITEK